MIKKTGGEITRSLQAPPAPAKVVAPPVVVEVPAPKVAVELHEGALEKLGVELHKAPVLDTGGSRALDLRLSLDGDRVHVRSRDEIVADVVFKDLSPAEIDRLQQGFLAMPEAKLLDLGKSLSYDVQQAALWTAEEGPARQKRTEALEKADERRPLHLAIGVAIGTALAGLKAGALFSVLAGPDPSVAGTTMAVVITAITAAGFILGGAGAFVSMQRSLSRALSTTLDEKGAMGAAPVWRERLRKDVWDVARQLEKLLAPTPTT